MRAGPRPLTAMLAPALALWAIAASSAAAHELRPGYLEITETSAETYKLRFKAPGKGDLRLGLYVRLPETCADHVPPNVEKAENAFIDHRTVVCSGGLAGRAVVIDGLSGTLTDVIARVALSDGVRTVRLTPENPSFEIAAAPGPAKTARAYFLLGTEHILTGLDHLLFVLALLMLIGGAWALVKTVTAFTIAHSITLAAASLGWAHVPRAPVEALIALSIACAAAAIPRAEHGAKDLLFRAPWLGAFAFGLLHGFGFGGALTEIGLPQSDAPLALLAFNLGVEAGQLAFVAALLALGAALRRAPCLRPDPGRVALAYGIGGLAVFWMIERCAALF